MIGSSSEVFRAGVKRYLDRHAFGNTETGDLWVALGEAAGQQVPAVMDGWVFRPGYPMLSVSAEGDRLVLRPSTLYVHTQAVKPIHER